MIVVAGESLVDLIVDEDLQIVARPGGAPLNVARGLARLGAHSVFIGGLSSDRFGDLLRETLLADGVDPRCLFETDLPTMLAVAEVRAGVASYHFHTQGTAAAALRAEDVATQCPQHLTALYVGGIALGLDALGATIEFMVASAPREALVLVDPNIRPGATPDPDRLRTRLDAILERADVVKASTDDLAWIVPGADPDAAARTLLERGPACALVTDGVAGARIVTREAVVHVPAVPVTVVDTVGAGDAFCAGFLAWWAAEALGPEDLADHARLLAAAEHATLVAAITCERVGALPPTADEVAQFAAAHAAHAG